MYTLITDREMKIMKDTRVPTNYYSVQKYLKSIRRIFAVCLMSCGLCLVSGIICSSSVYAADIYYSVGTDSSDLKTTTNVTITGGKTTPVK